MKLKFICTIIVLLIFSSCTNKKTSPSEKPQRAPLTSADARYTLVISITENNQNGFIHWWDLRIKDSSGELYVISNDDFPARFNIYHRWDNEDRIWIYNSDDGAVFFWVYHGGEWHKNRYDNENHTFSSPDDLIPVY